MTLASRCGAAAALAAVVALGAAAGSRSPLAAAGAEESVRRAPLRLEGEATSLGLTLMDPRVEDVLSPEDANGRGGRRMAALLFRVGESAGTAALEARFTLPDGVTRTVALAEMPARAGAEIRLPVDIPVPHAAEGRIEVLVTARSRRGKTLFSARYSLGFPRYATTRGLTLVRGGAFMRDAFDADAIDDALWAVNLANPGAAAVAPSGGRLKIHLEGRAGYNGLAGRTRVESRDVVLVARMGIDAAAKGNHRALLHLCGSDGLSPDNWFEVAMGRVGSGSTVYLNLSSPEHEERAGIGEIPLEGLAAEGRLFQITCDPAAHACRGYARVGDAWSPIGGGFEIPARTTRVELKAEGWNGAGESSTIWFDDVRLYPSPETHYVSVRLRRAYGGAIGLGAGGRWPPLAFDAGSLPLEEGDVTVRLYSRDGVTLVDEAVVTLVDGFALLRLDASPWDVYPVGAVVRVYIRGAQAGPDHVIESAGVEGLYPDDVYEVGID